MRYVGRHRRPSHTLRNTAIVAAAVAAGGTGLVFAPTASADPVDGCTAGSHNPDVKLCQDRQATDGDNDLHALLRVDPVCVHLAVPDRRRVVGTRDCNHPAGVVPAYPAYPTYPAPVYPAPAAPAPCPQPVGATPCPCPPAAAPPVVSPPAETAPPTQFAPLPTAPAPTIITNNTATSPLPAVTG